MRYLGGKTRLAKHIKAAILSDTPERGRYVEPFVGGGSVFVALAPEFDTAIGNDLHEDLSLMWNAVANGWLPPEHLSEDEYRDLRHAEPSPLRAFAGFGCSFGGKWFGGYARGTRRDFPNEGRRRVVGYAPRLRRVLQKQQPGFQGKVVLNVDYRELEIKSGDVVYCDPPYADTQGYTTGGFDHADFWATMDAWTELGAHVYVSEFTAPDHWESIWEKERNVTVAKDKYHTRIDKLWRRK